MEVLVVCHQTLNRVFLVFERLKKNALVSLPFPELTLDIKISKRYSCLTPKIRLINLFILNFSDDAVRKRK